MEEDGAGPRIDRRGQQAGASCLVEDGRLCWRAGCAELTRSLVGGLLGHWVADRR